MTEKASLEELFAEAEPYIVIKQDVTEGNKYCNGCKQVKPVTEFYSRRDRSSADRYGKVSKCKSCNTAAYNTWYEKNKEAVKKKARENQYMKRHAGCITQEEAAKLADSNVGYCDICSDYGMIYLDHDHQTEARRGFLCGRCNLALGGFQDSAELLQRAAAYLLRYL